MTVACPTVGFTPAFRQHPNGEQELIELLEQNRRNREVVEIGQCKFSDNAYLVFHALWGLFASFLSCFDRGEQVDRPLYRFRENLGLERNRQKRWRPILAKFFGPAALEVEDFVSLDEIKPPLPQGFTRSTPRTM